MTETRRPLVAYLAVAVAACAWGTWPLILKRAETFAKMDATLTSTIVMGVLTLVSAVLMLRDRISTRASVRDWLAVAWLGVADAANILLFFKAYQVTSVAIAVLTHYLTPILVAIGAPFVLGERGSRRGWVAVALSFAGLVLLLGPWRVRTGEHDGLGALFGAGSAVFYASNVFVNKRLVSVFATSELMCFHGLVATPLLAVLVPREVWGAIDARAAFVILGGAIGPGALAGLVFVYGLRKIPASHASTLTLLEPLVAVLASVAFLGESLGPASIVGGTLILVGALVVATQAMRPSRKQDTAVHVR